MARRKLTLALEPIVTGIGRPFDEEAAVLVLTRDTIVPVDDPTALRVAIRAVLGPLLRAAR